MAVSYISQFSFYTGFGRFPRQVIEPIIINRLLSENASNSTSLNFILVIGFIAYRQNRW